MLKLFFGQNYVNCTHFDVENCIFKTFELFLLLSKPKNMLENRIYDQKMCLFYHFRVVFLVPSVTRDLIYFLKTFLLVDLTCRACNGRFILKNRRVVDVRSTACKIDHPTFFKKTGTNGWKTIINGLPTISTIVHGPIHAKKSGEKKLYIILK